MRNCILFDRSLLLLLILGRPLEELLDELREEERKNMEAEVEAENPATDDGAESQIKDSPDPLKDNDGKIKASTGYASCIGLVIILILLISCVLFVELFMY